MATSAYSGKYKKLFPGVLSSNSLLSVYILNMLSKSTEMYGKEVADKIEKQLQGTWTPSHGLIYPMLRNMEDEGLVEGRWEGNGTRKTIRYYAITDKGREALLIEKANIQPMFKESQKMLDIIVEDLAIES